MDLEGWEKTLPEAITGDVLWRVQAYRLALYAAECAWEDVTTLAGEKRTRAVADQLFRALGSISANIAEGYSRGFGRERAHFYEYALGSAREARDWYYKVRRVLGEGLVEERIGLLTQIIRLLLTMVADQRSRALKEETASYGRVDVGSDEGDMGGEDR